MPADTGSQTVRRWLPLMRELREAWPVQEERPPLSLWAALIDAESGGHPGAISPQGAVGLGQVMPSDYAGYSEYLRRIFRDRPTTARLLNPQTNLSWSLRILVTLGYRRCGSWDAALMAYFTGRCHAPTAQDSTGTSGAQYVRIVLARRDRYADLDASPPARGEPVEPRPDPSHDHTALTARLAALERQLRDHAADGMAHRHSHERVGEPAALRDARE